jgi:hypothetical protein
MALATIQHQGILAVIWIADTLRFRFAVMAQGEPEYQEDVLDHEEH